MSQEKSDELNQNPKPASDVLTNNTHAPDATNYPNAAVNIDKPANDRLVNDESIVNDNLTDSDEPSMPPIPPKEPIPSSDGWSPKKKSYLNLGILIALIVIGVALILYAWKLPPFTPTVQQTNNAFVKGQTTIISPQVSGYVTEVAVKDFATVKEGDLLIKVDDRTFRQQLEQAQANVQQAEANLQVAREASEKTSGSRSSLDANIKSAEAGAKQAQINLDNTVISAPESGQLSQISVKEGQYVSAGTQLMCIVPKGVWIIANFKETQVANMRIGEPVTIHVDALGGTKFSGHVSNISPATGSEFSAGAANPATGNYIKIAQRVPVRIDLAQNQPNLAQLRPGMSVSVNVDTKARS